MGMQFRNRRRYLACGFGGSRCKSALKRSDRLVVEAGTVMLLADPKPVGTGGSGLLGVRVTGGRCGCGHGFTPWFDESNRTMKILGKQSLARQKVCFLLFELGSWKHPAMSLRAAKIHEN